MCKKEACGAAPGPGRCPPQKDRAGGAPHSRIKHSGLDCSVGEHHMCKCWEEDLHADAHSVSQHRPDETFLHFDLTEPPQNFYIEHINNPDIKSNLYVYVISGLFNCLFGWQRSHWWRKSAQILLLFLGFKKSFQNQTEKRIFMISVQAKRKCDSSPALSFWCEAIDGWSPRRAASHKNEDIY